MISKPLPRRRFLQQSAALLAACALTPKLFSQQTAPSLTPLEVASAGSIRALLDGPLKAAAARTLHLDLRSHSGGADAVAQSLVDGSLHADLFIPITASPMRIAMDAGKIATAYSIARTELVLLYSPKSRFLAQFEAAAQGKADWWKILQQPDIRIAHSNPRGDPSGRAIFFTMMLAAQKYNQPDLVEKVLGAPLNPAQVIPNGAALLQTGEVDAMCVYKTGPANTGQPYISLSTDINLSRTNVRDEHPDLKLTVADKTFYPEPLIFYAGILKDAPNPIAAQTLLAFLQSDQGRAILQANHFEAPANATPITA